MHEPSGQLINWWSLGSAFKDSPALGWHIITFLIFIWALVYFVRKPLMLLLETRALNIEKAIEEAKLAKAQALAQSSKYEARLKSIDTEIANLKSDFLKQGELEREAFEKSARSLALQVAKEAEDNLQADVRRAIFSLKNEMADAVIAATTRKVQESMSSSSAHDLTKVFIRDVSELKN